jgi:hypothetical protein
MLITSCYQFDEKDVLDLFMGSTLLITTEHGSVAPNRKLPEKGGRTNDVTA